MTLLMGFQCFYFNEDHKREKVNFYKKNMIKIMRWFGVAATKNIDHYLGTTNTTAIKH